MYIDAHTHTIRSGEPVVAVYSMLPGPRPRALPDTWFVSAGVHPWLCARAGFADACEALGAVPGSPVFGGGDYDDAMRHWLDTLDRLAARRHIIAVGETGLDRVHDKDLSTQRTVFEAHLQIAERHDLPVMIHCVRAVPELLTLRKRYDGTPWILHGFRGKTEAGRQLIRHNIHLSFGAALLRSSELQRVARDVPPAFMFLETDQSACGIVDIYTAAAAVLSMEPAALRQRMSDNFDRVFVQRVAGSQRATAGPA